MYIACPYLDCLRQYAVHKPYNRRLRGHVPQLLYVFHYLNTGGNGVLFFHLTFIKAFEGSQNVFLAACKYPYLLIRGGGNSLQQQ